MSLWKVIQDQGEIFQRLFWALLEKKYVFLKETLTLTYLSRRQAREVLELELALSGIRDLLDDFLFKISESVIFPLGMVPKGIFPFIKVKAGQETKQTVPRMIIDELLSNSIQDRMTEIYQFLETNEEIKQTTGIPYYDSMARESIRAIAKLMIQADPYDLGPIEKVLSVLLEEENVNFPTEGSRPVVLIPMQRYYEKYYKVLSRLFPRLYRWVMEDPNRKELSDYFVRAFIQIVQYIDISREQLLRNPYTFVVFNPTFLYCTPQGKRDKWFEEKIRAWKTLVDGLLLYPLQEKYVEKYPLWRKLIEEKVFPLFDILRVLVPHTLISVFLSSAYIGSHDILSISLELEREDRNAPSVFSVLNLWSSKKCEQGMWGKLKKKAFLKLPARIAEVFCKGFHYILNFFVRAPLTRHLILWNPVLLKGIFSVKSFSFEAKTLVKYSSIKDYGILFYGEDGELADLTENFGRKIKIEEGRIYGSIMSSEDDGKITTLHKVGSQLLFFLGLRVSRALGLFLAASLLLLIYTTYSPFIGKAKLTAERFLKTTGEKIASTEGKGSGVTSSRDFAGIIRKVISRVKTATEAVFSLSYFNKPCCEEKKLSDYCGETKERGSKWPEAVVLLLPWLFATVIVLYREHLLDLGLKHVVESTLTTFSLYVFIQAVSLIWTPECSFYFGLLVLNLLLIVFFYWREKLLVPRKIFLWWCRLSPLSGKCGELRENIRLIAELKKAFKRS